MRILYLLDGTYELFRGYYALPSLTGPNGREVGAVRGLVGSVLALLREADPTHIAAATDHVVESFRNRLFAGYKTGAGLPSNLLDQFPLAEQALRSLGMTVWPMTEFEADDALATAARRFRSSFDRIVILSPDKDLMQCVMERRIVVRDRLRKRVYDAAAVEAKFGVPPSAIPDLLALVGDAADGIPGVPGWGLKSAPALLARYGRLESIPLNSTQWKVRLRGRERLASTLAASRREAMLYKRLATLRTDVPLSRRISELAWAGVPRTRWRRFCTRLGFLDLAARPHRWA